jgi:hypothetical protein
VGAWIQSTTTVPQEHVAPVGGDTALTKSELAVALSVSERHGLDKAATAEVRQKLTAGGLLKRSISETRLQDLADPGSAWGKGRLSRTGSNESSEVSRLERPRDSPFASPRLTPRAPPGRRTLVRNKSDGDLSTMSSFESQRKSLGGLMSERQALLYKLDSNKRRSRDNKENSVSQDANTRAREEASLVSRSDDDKRLSGQSQRDTVPSSSISDWMKQHGEETESGGGEEAQGTIFLSEFDLARAMTQVHESGSQLTKSLWIF